MLMFFSSSLYDIRAVFTTYSVTLKSSFVQLQVCISLAEQGYVVYCHGVSSASLCPSLSPCACTLMRCTLPLYFSMLLLSYPSVFLYTTSLWQSHKYLTIHEITAYCFYFSKTMIVQR